MTFKVYKAVFTADSGYCVLNCDILDEKGKVSEYDVTVTGTMLPTVTDTVFEAEAEKVNNKKYGEQYKVISFVEKDPDDIEGIINLILASKLKGIGKKKAQKIVNAFGHDTLKVLDEDFMRISKLKIGKEESLEIAKKQWEDSRKIREMIKIIGKSTGIAQGKLLTLKNYFGDEVVDVLKNHPFRITNVKGITFYQAEKLARNQLSYNPYDNERIEAGVVQALLNAGEMKGHLFLLSNELIVETLSLLNADTTTPVNQELVKNVVNGMCKSEILTCTKVANGLFAIYLTAFYSYEVKTVEKIVDMLKPETKIDEALIVGKIKELEEKNKISLEEKQKEAVINSQKYNFSIITGGPGTGKTTTLRLLIELFKELKSDGTVCMMAPSGRAASRMREVTSEGASTIHSKLGLRAERDNEEVNEITEDLVIIDEMSMVDAKLFSQVLDAIKKKKKLILVGDVNQLPSVGAGNVFYELINSGVLPVVKLEVPFRQSEDNLIYKNCELINKGVENLVYGDDFQIIKAQGEAEIAKLCEKLYLDEVEKRGLENVSVLSPYRKKTLIGSDELNLMLKIKANRTKNLVTVKVGKKTYNEADRVMQLKNIQTEEGGSLSNGDIGYITNIVAGTENDSSITVSYEGIGTYTYETKEDFEMLDLAYAMTIHKSQGSEYQSVIIPMSMRFKPLLKRNLILTGVSRAKKKVYIVGDVTALKTAIRDNTYARRNTLLGARIRKKMQENIKYEQMSLLGVG